MDVKQKLRLLRARDGLRQRDLAEKIGESELFISKIECGRVRPSQKVIEKLAAAFGVSAAALTEPDHE